MTINLVYFLLSFEYEFRNDVINVDADNTKIRDDNDGLPSFVHQPLTTV